MEEDLLEGEGGPVHPEPIAVKGNILVKQRTAHAHPGISLRDHFASQAMMGLLIASRGIDYDPGKVAREAYKCAEQMLREKSNSKARKRKEFD